MKAAALVVLIASSASAQAWSRYAPSRAPLIRAASAPCARVNPVHVQNTQVYADGLASGLCYVSIQPNNSTDLVYRSLAFFSGGLMMVFSSYGAGDDPALTSAREFWFFPRLAAPTVAADAAAGTIAVTLPDGGVATIDPATAQLSALDRGTVRVEPRVDPALRGGVEIPSYRGLILDAGYRRGESPSGRPAASSTFRDAQGHSCAVKNSELWTYSGGEHYFKMDDAALSAWLKTRCPGLVPGF